MAGDNKIMLTFFVWILLTSFLYIVCDIISQKRKHKKKRQKRYEVYRAKRRVIAKEYARQLQLVYLRTLY